VFENRVLSRIFGTKREEVAGGWGKLHAEDLHTLHASPSTYYRGNEVKDEMGCECSTHGRYEKCIQNFGRKI
jgi:hypothetical protein